MHVMWLPHLMDIDLFKGDASIVVFAQIACTVVISKYTSMNKLEPLVVYFVCVLKIPQTIMNFIALLVIRKSSCTPTQKIENVRQFSFY
jgi:hypothetical protein